MTTLLHDVPTALISPSPEPRISGVDEEDLVRFMETADDLFADNVFDPEDPTSLLGEDEFDSFFPTVGLDKLKELPEIVSSLPDESKKAPQIIANALQAMPMEQREQIVRELYGIEKVEATFTGTTNHVEGLPVTTQEEDDENFLDQKLEEMNQELQRLRKANSWNLKMAALDMAEAQNLEYTQNRVFRLKFLRCDRFDAARAAARFIRFFDWKMELFGVECLTREITLNDLTAEDRAALKKGYSQRLPVRDRAGRAILVNVYNGQTYHSPESIARLYFYLGCHVDEETDKKGWIVVFFKIKDYQVKKSTRALGGCFYLRRVASDFPIRVDAYHKFLETEESMMHKLVDYVVGAMHPEIVARARVHYGKHEEWMRDLMSFGIPQDVIPFTQSYKIKTKNHMEYMAMRARQEEILASVPATVTADQLIDLPSRKDVLLGKGKPIQFSSGNQRLSSIIDGYLDEYQGKSKKEDKTALAMQVVQMVKANGVRFLSKESGVWMEVDDDLARDKVSHMFRHQLTKSGSKKNSKGKVRAAPENASQPELIPEDQAKRARV